MTKRSSQAVFVAVVSILLVGGIVCAISARRSGSRSEAPLRISIPPFVDTAFTVVGLEKGFFSEKGVALRPVNSAWENQYELIAGGELDVAMSTIDEFVNKD